MNKFALTRALATIAFTLHAASGEPIAPVARDTVEHLAQMCTADGAFGHRFGEKPASDHPGLITLSPEWAPFSSLDLRSAPDVGVYQIMAFTTWIRDTAQNPARRDQIAQWAAAINTEIAATHQFAHRKESDASTTYYSRYDGTPGFSLTVAITPLTFDFKCVDENRESQVADRIRQSAPAQRPLAPELPLPPRLTNAVCANAASRKKQIAGINELRASYSRYLTAHVKYHQQLQLWIGQQLIDKQVWTTEQRRLFEFSVDRDMAIDVAQQLLIDRAVDSQMAGLTFKAADKDEERCEAVVAGMSAAYDAAAAAKSLASRTQELYAAKLHRLNVHLDP